MKLAVRKERLHAALVRYLADHDRRWIAWFKARVDEDVRGGWFRRRFGWPRCRACAERRVRERLEADPFWGLGTRQPYAEFSTSALSVVDAAEAGSLIRLTESDLAALLPFLDKPEGPVAS